jgi:hypothetical protein
MSGIKPQRISITEARVGGDDAQIGAEGDLQTAAESDAVDHGDHRHRDLGPHPGGALGPVGRRSGVALEQARAAVGSLVRGQRCEAREVEAGAERPPFAAEHDAAHRAVVAQRQTGRDQGLEHGRIESVELVGAIEAHVGDALLDGDADPGFDGLSRWPCGHDRPRRASFNRW